MIHKHLLHSRSSQTISATCKKIESNAKNIKDAVDGSHRHMGYTLPTTNLKEQIINNNQRQTPNQPLIINLKHLSTTVFKKKAPINH